MLYTVEFYLSYTSSALSLLDYLRIQDLQWFIIGLELPNIVKVHGYCYTRDEVMMMFLTRLSYPNRDVAIRFPGSSPSICQRAFYWFIDFMISNWGYLILNDREYWVPHMAASANAIRAKLQQLPNLANRLYFENAHKNGGLLFLVLLITL